MNYAEAKDLRDRLEAALKAACATLDAYPKGAFNLTPDHIKFSPEYQSVNNRADKLFKSLREVNSYIVKNFKKERLAERFAERGY